MIILRQSSRAVPVKLLQRLLNKKGASPRLVEDGFFGPKTHDAVMAFQTREPVHEDGVVGPATWTELGLVIDATHNVRQFGQSAGMTCWSAAATMIVSKRPAGRGGAGMTAVAEMAPGAQNVRRFADGLGWKVHLPQDWSVDGLARLLQRGPVWAVGGESGWRHAIVVSAMWSDGDPDASGTMLRIHDPLPVPVGSVYGHFYRAAVDGFDFNSLYVLEPV